MAGRTIRRNRQRDSGDKVEVIDVAGIDSGNDSVEIGAEISDTGSEVVGVDTESGDGEQSGPEVIDPSTIGVESGEPVRRRGRKPGTKNKPKVASFQAGNLEKLLLSGHIMLAAVTGASELVIDEQEAKLLADSVAAVNSAYGLDSIISPKVAAVVDLSFACAAVYGPRMVKIAKRAKQTKKPILVRQNATQEKPFHPSDPQNIVIPENGFATSTNDVRGND